MPPRKMIVPTSSAVISVADSGGHGMPVLLIHGNSSCKEVFQHQLEGPVGERYRLIALDLPGHGESGDAAEPRRTYSFPGYANACAEVLQALRITRAAVLGWSLGGHVALELAQRNAGLAGLMIVGAPPFAHGIFGMMRAFQPRPGLYLATKGRLSRAEVRLLARGSLGKATNEFFENRIERTDPRARSFLFRSMMRGEGADQKRVAEGSPLPLAVVNGSAEPVARLSYLARLAYANLWEGRCHVIDGAGHAPFLQAPEAFDPLLLRFLDDLARARGQESESRDRLLPLSA